MFVCMCVRNMAVGSLSSCAGRAVHLHHIKFGNKGLVESVLLTWDTIPIPHMQVVFVPGNPLYKVQSHK
jgi:hypothetical protein